MKLAYLVTYEAYRLGAIRKQSKLYQSESQIVDGDSFIAMQDSISRNAVSTGEADSIDGVVITGASLLNPISQVELPESTRGRDIASLHDEADESLAMLQDVEDIMYKRSGDQPVTAMGKVATILQRLSCVSNKSGDEYVEKLETENTKQYEHIGELEAAFIECYQAAIKVGKVQTREIESRFRALYDSVTGVEAD